MATPRRRIRKHGGPPKIGRWGPIVQRGTGFFGYTDSDSASAIDARLRTWAQAQDAIRSLRRSGSDDQLLKACALHLAEVADRIRRQEPPTVHAFEEAASILAQAGGHADAARRYRENPTRENRSQLEQAHPHETRERKRVHHALHFGSNPKEFESELPRPHRRVGAPGERDAVRIVSALAYQLAPSGSERKVPWDRLLALVENVFPPLFTGARIPKRTMKHQSVASRLGMLFRPPGARLRSAVMTYRRDRRKYEPHHGGSTYDGGSTDLAELKAELVKLQRRAQKKAAYRK
jgi:hypothetical protein